MSDNLDFIAQLRPPSAEPAPEVVRTERGQLMDFINSSSPQRTRRRTRRLVASVGVSIVAMGGAAAAAGLIPQAVTDRFAALEQRDGVIEIDSDLATMVAAAADGTNEAQLWVAPTEGGDRECLYVRWSWLRTNGEGVAENGPVGCEDRLLPWTEPDFKLDEPSDYLASLDVLPIGSAEDGYLATAITGAAHPDVATVIVTLADGAKITVDVASPDGWFAVVFAGDALAGFSKPALSVALIDHTGQLIGEIQSWAGFGASPVTTIEGSG